MPKMMPVMQPLFPTSGAADAAHATSSDQPPDDMQVMNPTFDLEQYASNYTGLAKIYRLLYIVEHCPLLRADAMVMAVNYIKQNTYNWPMYQRLYQSFSKTNQADSEDTEMSAALAAVPPYDQQWVEQTTKKASVKLDKLDQELKHYKSNSIKESIRRGQDDLGEHYLEMGDLSSALKCFSRARDYCTTNKHVIAMCFNVIKVSVYTQNWPLVLNYVNRAETSAEAVPTQVSKDLASNRLQTMSKLKCAAGIAELALGRYKAAAKLFLQVSFDHLEYAELLSPNSVAIYGSLCALATFDRQQLQSLVIGNAGFKQFLELEPQLNEIVMKFYGSQYAQCLLLLDEIKDNMLLDIYLHSHVETLYGYIRNRGLIQYFSPYLSADMRRMAAAFNTSVASLEDEVMQLILDGQIKARIDSNNKILYAKDFDQRMSTYKRSFAVGKMAAKYAKIIILRKAMHAMNICVKAEVRDPLHPGGNEGASTAPVDGTSSPV